MRRTGFIIPRSPPLSRNSRGTVTEKTEGFEAADESHNICISISPA